MDAVRRVAHQHQPLVDVTFGVDEAEREPPARPDRLDLTQIVAEAPGELGFEAFGLELEQALGKLCAFGPDNRRAMLTPLAIAHRQDGEWSAGQEFLLSDASMRPFVACHH